MTEDDVAQIELAVSVRLPLSYRNILVHYPEFPTCDGDPDFRPQDCGLYASKSELMTANVNDGHYMREIFPPSFFVIGESGCGDYFAIDTLHPDAPVYISGPHHGEYPMDIRGDRVPAYGTLALYIDSIRQDILDWQGDQPIQQGRIGIAAQAALAIAAMFFGVMSLFVVAVVAVPIWGLLRVFKRLALRKRSILG